MSFEIEPPLIQRKTAGSFFSKSQTLKRFYINRLKKKFWPLSQQKKNEPLISESIEWIWNEISIQCLIIEAKEGGRRKLKGHSLFSRWVSIPPPLFTCFSSTQSRTNHFPHRDLLSYQEILFHHKSGTVLSSYLEASEQWSVILQLRRIRFTFLVKYFDT